MRKSIIEFVRKCFRLPKEEVYIWVELFEKNSVYPESLGYYLPKEAKDFVEFMNKFTHDPRYHVVLKLKTQKQVLSECF